MSRERSHHLSHGIRWSFLALEVYDILLAVGALWYGLRMLKGIGLIFSFFPPEWVDKLPFESWTPIGAIALFFAVGNAVAAALCLLARRNRALASLGMGILLMIGMIAQIIILGEAYMATGQFLLVALIQIIFSLVLMIRRRFVATATEHAR